MTRQDYARLREKTIEHKPSASIELIAAREDMESMIDDYIAEVELDTFIWAFELGRAWERKMHP